ncbi:MAG: methyltransferase domain-containing protein [Planctomycetota bacterium]
MAASSENNEYLLGCDTDELHRLGFQHRVWGEASHALWHRAQFAPGQQLLDVGCGPGYATIDLAHIVGEEGRIVAIDESPRFLNHLRNETERASLSQVDVREGQVESIELEPATYDGAYARWIFCFLSQPTQLIEHLAKALKPGASLAIVDYYHYRALTLAPRGPALDRAVHAVFDSWTQSGGNLEIGGVLPQLLEERGFEVEHIDTLIESARPDSLLWHWPRRFFFGYIPRLIEMGLLTEDDRQQFEDEWLQREKTPGAFLLTPPMVEIVARRR